MKELRMPIYLTDIGAGEPNKVEAARATAARDAKFFKGTGVAIGPPVPLANTLLPKRNREMAARERRRARLAPAPEPKPLVGVPYVPKPLVEVQYVPKPLVVPPAPPRPEYQPKPLFM